MSPVKQPTAADLDQIEVRTQAHQLVDGFLEFEASRDPTGKAIAAFVHTPHGENYLIIMLMLARWIAWQQMQDQAPVAYLRERVGNLRGALRAIAEGEMTKPEMRELARRAVSKDDRGTP